MPGLLNFQDFSTVQSQLQPMPTTLASASVIAPQTFITLITGSTTLDTVTPPLPGIHMLVLVSSGGTWAWSAAGNITTAGAAVVAGEMVVLFFNPNTNKYHAGKLTLTQN